jgi:hypothetical protein
MDRRRSVDASASPTPHAEPRHKSIPHFARKHQLVTLIISDDQRIQRIVWRVAANHESLRLVELVLQPCAGSLADLVARILALCDDVLKPKLFNYWGLVWQGLCRAYLTF